MGVNGQVVLVRQNGLGTVMTFAGDQTTTLWEFEDAVCQPCISTTDYFIFHIQPQSLQNSDSIYVSSSDGEGRSYIGRIFWSHSTQVSNDSSNAVI